MIAMDERTQQLLQQAQVLQQQIQSIVAQKEVFNLQLLEIKNALGEMETNKDDEVYKISGPILVKSKADDVKKELNEKLEIIDMKIKGLDKSEKRVKEKIEELRDRISKSSSVYVDSKEAG